MTKDVAHLLIRRISTMELCKVYDESALNTTQMDVMNEALIRGWIMAELKSRDLKAYRIWIGSRGDSPTPYYKEDE